MKISNIISFFSSFFREALYLVGLIFGVFLYANRQAKRSERSKAASMLLDDVIAAKKSDSAIDSLTNSEVDSRLHKFERKKRNVLNRKPD